MLSPEIKDDASFSSVGTFFPHLWFPFIAWAVFLSSEKFKMLAARVGCEDIPDIEGQGWKESSEAAAS